MKQKDVLKTLDHDPTSNHIKIVSEWPRKWLRKGEIKQRLEKLLKKDWNVIKDAPPRKNSTLTNKQGNKEIQYDYLLPVAIQQ